MKFRQNILKATISTMALAMSACGGSDSPPPAPPPPPEPATLTGAAVKGLILNGYVSVEAENATAPGETIGRTDATTGNFSLEIGGTDPGVVNVSQPLMRVFVTGGPDATMICDAADGCGTVAFGDPVPITENLVLSAIVPIPEAGTAMDVNVNLFTSLVAESIVTSNGVDISTTEQEVADIFGLSVMAIRDLPPIDVTDAGLDAADSEAQDDVAAALVAAGVLNAAFEDPAGFEAGLSGFINGDIVADGVVARESVDDLSVITLEEILQGSRAAISQSTTGIAAVDTALAAFEDEIALTPPDQPTVGGELPVDTTAPVVTVSNSTASLASGATETISSSATDNLGVTSGPVYSCTNGGTVDANDVFTAPVVSAVTDVVCTVSYGDLAGNMGSNTFTATVAAETVNPFVTINTDPVAIAGGATVALDFTASDNVAVVTETVTCDNGDVTIAGTSVTAPFLAAPASSICTLIVADAAGNQASDTVTLNIAAETVAPFIDTEASIGFASGGVGVGVPFTVSDNLAVASTNVVCANPAVTVDGMTLNAPAVAADFSTVCTITATDTAGNFSTANFTANVLKEATAPTINANDNLVVESGESEALTFTLADNLSAVGDITSSVSCTTGASFAAGIVTADTVTAVPNPLPVCTISATDEAGNVGIKDVTIDVRLETEKPTIDLASSSDITINSGGVAEINAVSGGFLNFSIPVADNVSVASGDISCTSGISPGSSQVVTALPQLFTGNVVVDAFAIQTTLACMVTVTDTSGNDSDPVALNIIAAPEATDPVIEFPETSVTVNSEGSVAFPFTIEDSLPIDNTTVTCDDFITYDETSEQITAPAVMGDVTSSCTVTATDAAGNTGSDSIPVTIAVDSTPPTLTVTPSSGAATSAAPLAVVVTSADDMGVASTTVTCNDSRVSFNEMASQIVVAPATLATFNATCNFEVADAAGNTTDQDVVVSVTPPPALPVVHFANTNGLAVLPITGAPTGVTTCSNGGTVSLNAIFTIDPSTSARVTVCSVQVEENDGTITTNEFTVSVGADSSEYVTISGNMTYDFVPHNGPGASLPSGLDYANASNQPIRKALVRVVDQNDVPVAGDFTDDQGNYTVRVRPNTQLQVSVFSVFVDDEDNPRARIRVGDNTNDELTYALSGSLAAIGNTNQTRDLNAPSGIDLASRIYTSTRAAAPFAVLDSASRAATGYLDADSALTFPDLFIGWSVDNRPVRTAVTLAGIPADLAQGNIGTSSYISLAGQDVGAIYILGDANNDTDEYDRHVIAHEWGHFYEDQASRSDSIGGAHSLGDILDPRTAWGEGYANALAGIIIGDSVYRDSGGNLQNTGFGFDVDENTNENPGWYSEGSIQSIVYDVFDSANDDADTVGLGLSAIHEAMTDPDYLNQATATTVFSFLEQLKVENPSSATAITALATAQSINGTGYTGAGETNNGGVATSLPLYHTVNLGGTTTQLCSSDDVKDITDGIIDGDRGEPNRLGNWNFGLISGLPAINTLYTFNLANTSGDATSPVVLRMTIVSDTFVDSRGPAPTGAGTFNFNAVSPGGTGRIQFASSKNINGARNTTDGDTCYNVSVTAN